MTHPYDIRVLLCQVAIFVAGMVWWCEDCGAGGFLPYDPYRHDRGCNLHPDMH